MRLANKDIANRIILIVIVDLTPNLLEVLLLVLKTSQYGDEHSLNKVFFCSDIMLYLYGDKWHYQAISRPWLHPRTSSPPTARTVFARRYWINILVSNIKPHIWTYYIALSSFVVLGLSPAPLSWRNMLTFSLGQSVRRQHVRCITGPAVTRLIADKICTVQVGSRLPGCWSWYMYRFYSWSLSGDWCLVARDIYMS